MSIDAMRWAKPIKTGRSSSKAVLTWLADMCGADLTAYPSIAALADATELNVKTVQSSLKHLVELGLIDDTGERRGATRQVIVYRLVGVNESYADSQHTQKRVSYNTPKNGAVNKVKTSKIGNVTENGCVSQSNTTKNGDVLEGK
ncbi:MAG: helix-turn-helix domain-containing protein, partial [Plesiomonas sp.]